MQGASDGHRDSRGKRACDRYHPPSGGGGGRVVDRRSDRLAGQGKMHRRDAARGLHSGRKALRGRTVPGDPLDRRSAGHRYRNRGDEGASVRRPEIHGLHRRLRKGDLRALCGDEGHHHDALRRGHPGDQFCHPAGLRQCGGGGLRDGDQWRRRAAIGLLPAFPWPFRCSARSPRGR